MTAFRQRRPPPFSLLGCASSAMAWTAAISISMVMVDAPASARREDVEAQDVVDLVRVIGAGSRSQ
jgi:hypothetical protein